VVVFARPCSRIFQKCRRIRIFIIFIGYGSAPSGSGKTHKSVDRAVDLVHRGERVLFLSPTKELSTKTAITELRGRVPYRIINEDTVGKGNVTAELVRHFQAPSELVESLVFATHAVLPLIPYITIKRHWHVIVDEEIHAVQYASHQLPITHPVITNDIQLEPYNSIYSRIVPDKSLKAKGRNKDNDDCIKVIAETVRRLTNPHWFNCVNTEQHERLRRGEIRTLAFHSILAPSIVDGFASVFMTAANFEATMLYQIWESWKALDPEESFNSQPTFIRDDGFTNSLRFQSHQNGHLIQIYYEMDATNSKKRLKDGVTESDSRNNRDRLIDTTRRLFGEEAFVWQANKGYDDNPFGVNAVRLPNVPDGLNDYAAYRNIAFLSALHPTPDHYRFLANHGLDAPAVYNAIYYQAAYQSVMRTALRDPNNQHPIKIFVPDIGAAQYLQSVFDGATVVKIDSGIVQNITPKKSGRKRKWQDSRENAPPP
jgi:hypothetical protein